MEPIAIKVKNWRINDKHLYGQIFEHKTIPKGEWIRSAKITSDTKDCRHGVFVKTFAEIYQLIGAEGHAPKMDQI